ncbi:Uncharacterised protein [Vibrio cholerae]|nr:Uncharacterised protein [Vibrio cholerae]
MCPVCSVADIITHLRFAHRRIADRTRRLIRRYR